MHYVTENTLYHKTAAWLARANEHRPARRHVPFEPEHAALLVIDMQRLFTDPGSPAYLPASKVVMPNIIRLIAWFREQGRVIVYTRYAATHHEAPAMARFWRHVPGPEDHLAQLDPRLPLKGHDPVLRKASYSAYAATNLQEILSRQGCRQVVICGVMTHLCCDMAARESFVLGRVPFMVADAMASTCEALHLAALQTAAHGYAIVCSTSELL